MTKVNNVDVTPFDAAEYLTDEVSIAEFLNASVEMNNPAVLLEAICTVARARSMSQLAEASGLGRESLYKALKPGSQPRYETVMRVLGALGIEMVFKVPKPAGNPRKATVTKRAGRPTVPSRAAASGEKRSARLKAR